MAALRASCIIKSLLAGSGMKLLLSTCCIDFIDQSRMVVVIKKGTRIVPPC